MLKDHMLMTGRCPRTSLQLWPKFHSLFLQNSFDFQKSDTFKGLKSSPRMLYRGRNYAKVKMRVNPSFNCNEYLYLEGKYMSTAKTCKRFHILIVNFYAIMSCCHSSNHTVNSDAFVKNKKTHKDCS